MTDRAEKEQPEAPAKLSQFHVQDRAFRNEAGQIVVGQQAWRRLSPLQHAFAKGRLAGGCDRYTAQNRYDAGQRYSEIFALAQSSGRDSTQALNISRSADATPLSQAQSDALRALVTIHSHLGERDRRIIILVCGLEEWPTKAINTVLGEDYRHTVSARLRESLDALVEAMEATRRRPGHFNMGRTA